MATNIKSENEGSEDLLELKERCKGVESEKENKHQLVRRCPQSRVDENVHSKSIFEADPNQAHNDASLERFLRAWQTVDQAFTAVVKCNKWRKEYGVDSLSANDKDIQFEAATGKAVLLPQRDIMGRPIVYIAARKHNAYDRDIVRLTKFVVFMLEKACSQCVDDVIDNLCIVFDLKDFAIANMDYHFIKNLIWLLTKYYPERLGVCLITNASIIFYGCWAVIRRWLDEVTASKVTFISNDKQLCDFIDPDMLPQG